MLLGSLLAGATIASNAWAQSPQVKQSDPAPAARPARASTPYRNQPARMANREAAYFEAVWGIDDPRVKAVESGIILQFSYRVLDPEKAKVLSNKDFAPLLESPEKGVQLVVPSLEKVGQLRQAPHKIEAGKTYWMAFSNSGRILKPGDRVDIEIGSFHARGILVE
jgi:hypothetical protein